MVFFGANMLAAAFVYFFVPEMSGLSLEEIDQLFIEGVPAYKSYTWNKEVKARHNDGFSTVEKATLHSNGKGGTNGHIEHA